MIANDLEIDSHGKYQVRKQAIIQRKANDIRRFVNMLETNNIAYNKHLLTILKEQEDELLGQFYSLDNTINTRLIRYRDTETRALLASGFAGIKIVAPYELDFMNACFDKINLAYRVKENMKIVLGIGAGERVPKIIQEGYEDMTRSLPQYITARYGSTLPAIKISNAFTKLWEIMTVFEALIPNSKSKNRDVNRDKFRVFHICEAPGQMIISLKYFLEKKRRNIVNYDWQANSLNPYNKENQDTYGKGTIFADDYGLIRSNPKKWIWGADGTGDITRVKNIKWYRDVMKSGGGDGVDLIVGDGGLSTQSGAGLDPLVLQKLDLAQVVMVLACSRVGGSCVIKHFTPYIKKHTSTYSAAGFFIGFIYLYYLAFSEVNLFKPYTSNPDSGEFYVIGQGFLGVDNAVLERLYKILEQMEVNEGIIPRDKIPETFIYQISGFLERITNLNVMSIEKQNLLLTCYKDGQNPKLNKYLKCDNFLDKDKLVNIQRPRFEEWIKKYGFA
jgi:23S rRNA U2552 (ribose-2'-O)-methylase RlmE/FtsJ